MSIEQNEMQVSGIAATLSQCTLFKALNHEQLLEVAGLGKLEVIPKGTLITRAGDRLPGLYIVQTGRVQLFTQAPTEKQIISHILGAGMCYGETSVIPGESAMVNSVALSTVKIIHISAEAFMGLYKTIPELPLLISAKLCDYMRLLRARAQRMTGHSIEARLAGWLLVQPAQTSESENISGIAPNASDGIDVITMGISKAILARELGVTQQSLSRAFSKLRNQGMIRLNKKWIYILNRPEIQSCATDTQPAKMTACI